MFVSMMLNTILALTSADLPADGWIAFDQPVAGSAVSMACGRNGTASLESPNTSWFARNRDADEGHDTFTVFVALSAGTPERIRAFTPGCKVIDADRAVKVSLTSDAAAGLLIGWLEQPLSRLLSQEATAVLAHLDSDRVNDALEQLAETHSHREASQNALIWLAMRRGEAGRDIVINHLKPEWPLQHRKHAVTALGLSNHPEALATVRNLARDDDSAELRASAVTALGIAKAPGALADLHAILISDEADAVREQAIFWLSQLKNPQAAEILADVVRDPRYGKHRKTALFWLSNMSRKDSEVVLDELIGM
jgi:hypothetical protein